MQPQLLSTSVPPAPYWRPSAWLWGVVVGTAAQLQQAQLSNSCTYAAALVLGVLATLVVVLARRLSATPWLDRLLCLLAAAVLAWGATGWRAVQQTGTQLDPALEGVDVVLIGTIVAMPQSVSTGQRFRLAVERAEGPMKAIEPNKVLVVPPLVDLAWYGAWTQSAQPSVAVRAAAATVPHITAGQRWRLPVRMRAPHGSANPYGFDYELWMWEQGVQATGYVRVPHQSAAGNATAPQLLAEGQGYVVERMRQHVRDAMVQRLAPNLAGEGLPDAQSVHAQRAKIAGVLVALVTGEQRAIDREDWRVFRTTGVAHLMAISGLHITLFAWVASAVIGAAWRRSARLCLWLPAPIVAMWGGVLCALAYALFSGWGVPAQRTVLMLAVVALLKLSGRQWPWHATWLLACASVVAVQPMALLQAGFWLSFLAVGILFASDFRALTAQPVSATSQNRLKTALFKLCKEHWVVTVALTPLSLLLFGQISLVGLLANLVAIPWVTWVVTPLALLGVVLPWLWDAALWAMLPLLAWLQWLAQWPHAAVWLPVAPWWAALVAVAGGAWLVLPLPWQLRLMGVPCLLPALWWQPSHPPLGQFSLLALDVGQGQAVLVQTAHHRLLYDAGPVYGPGSNAGDRVVAPTLRALGAGALDMLVLSHADADHTGGAQAVLQQLRPAKALGSLTPAERYNLGFPSDLPWRDCAAGHAWDWDGVRFSVLHPPLSSVTANTMYTRSGNSASCVLHIQAAPLYGHAGTALLLGDVEKAQEQWMAVHASDLLPADVMLVPHHGSQTSSSPALLDAVQPHWAIAQAGYRNRFHHPAAVVMQRYADRHIPLRTTAECGAATWQSDQPLALACERQLRPRYWQHRMGGVPATPQSGAFPALPASSAPEVIEDVNAVPVSDEG